MLVGNHSPGAPVSTTLEPCRVAPYVNVPSIRLPSAYDRLQPFSGFSAFDPALFSAAQQVTLSSASHAFTEISSPVRSSGCSVLQQLILASFVSAISAGPGRPSSRAPRQTVFEKFEYRRSEIQSQETRRSDSNVIGKNLRYVGSLQALNL